MRTFAAARLLLALLLPPALTHSQQPAPPVVQRDPQALAILEQSFGAMGGARFTTVADILVDGSFTSFLADSKQGTFSAKVRGKDYRIETNIGGQKAVHAEFRANGRIQIGSAQDPAKQTAFPTPSLGFDLLPLSLRWADFNQGEIEVSGPEVASVDGRSCLKVILRFPPENKVVPTSGRRFEVSVDQASGLLLAISYEAALGGRRANRIPLEIRYADYRNHEGVLLPSTIERLIKGRPVATISVQSVRFNVGLSDADFQN